jgi:hypothetical protein
MKSVESVAFLFFYGSVVVFSEAGFPAADSAGGSIQ